MKRESVSYEEWCFPCKGFGKKTQDMVILNGKDYYSSRMSKRRNPPEIFSLVGGLKRSLLAVRRTLSIIDLREKNADYYK